jgi:hypothetical protein
MYHLRSDGGWNQQDYRYVSAGTRLYAYGKSGYEPCRKYAWTAGRDGTTLGWHGHNPAAC